MLTTGQRTAGKPNWTRKDYQVMAETCASICASPWRLANSEIEQLFINHCNQAAALTPNGNCNFDEAKFRKEVAALLEQ